MATLTPWMIQYQAIKDQYQDSILFFRMGDFYETFFEDAEITARVLSITLTARDKTREEGPIPLAGFPHHALDSYLYRMIRAGYKVAICEQVEDPKKTKGIVKRAVVRVVTPGTVTDPQALERKANNYLVSFHEGNGRYGFASVDLSTGEFAVTELENVGRLLAEVTRLSPSECLLSEDFEDAELLALVQSIAQPVMNRLQDWRFDFDTARQRLLDHFHTLSLDGFGCEHLPMAIRAAGALIHYIHETQMQDIDHIKAIHTYLVTDYMILDADAQRNLELTRSLRDNSTRGTLVEILDATLTPMGGRRLRQCLLQPLIDPPTINARLDAVEEFHSSISLQEEMRETFESVTDIERLISRISLGSANARDLLALKESFRLLPVLRHLLEESRSSMLQILYEQLDPMQDVADVIEQSIHPEPPASVREGRMIRDGYHPDLDQLRQISSSGKEWITSLQQQERERTGISSLKIGYNQVFGYYIEVTKTNLDSVPGEYIRKQTLTNSERFITPELKERESQILNAQEQINDLEYELFCQIRQSVAAETERIQKVAAVVGMLDVLTALAYLATKRHYVRPIVNSEDEIIIKDGRHPVVEQLFTREGFVPNDTLLNCGEQMLHIITGPNMSGKSTYLRQTALIALMAQMGSFVPASAAKIGVADRIFTRVGASDNLVMGQSTFLVEMNETANILNNATERSLIILDEIGRGTSTFDGLSIAWAVAEYILLKIKAKTLFATHYHELIELPTKYPQARNYNVAVHEDGAQVIFLRKVVEGGTDDSYGIHVARLAGLPVTVIERANEILQILEQHNVSVDRKAPAHRRRVQRQALRGDSLQLSLIKPTEVHPVVDDLRQLQLDNMTPIQALTKLYEIKAKVDASE